MFQFNPIQPRELRGAVKLWLSRFRERQLEARIVGCVAPHAHRRRPVARRRTGAAARGCHTVPRPAIVGTAQDAPAFVVALIAAAIAAGVPAGTSSAATYATVVTAIALTTLITGAPFLLLGAVPARLAGALPAYPVVGGFLAGTGWLLTLG